jgi:hypothetical protein
MGRNNECHKGYYLISGPRIIIYVASCLYGANSKIEEKRDGVKQGLTSLAEAGIGTHTSALT